MEKKGKKIFQKTVRVQGVNTQLHINLPKLLCEKLGIVKGSTILIKANNKIVQMEVV